MEAVPVGATSTLLLAGDARSGVLLGSGLQAVGELLERRLQVGIEPQAMAVKGLWVPDRPSQQAASAVMLP